MRKQNSINTAAPDNQALDVKDNTSLVDLSDYYLIEDHEKFNWRKHLFLTSVSLLSMWMYITTSAAAGADNAEQTEYQTFSAAVNFFVTYNVVEAFYDAGKVSLGVIIAALLSALPLSLAVYSNTEEVTPLDYMEIGETLVVNTFIHCLPVMLLAENPVMRFLSSLPTLPYRGLKVCCMTTKEHESKQIQENTAKRHARLKAGLVNNLTNARDNIKKLSFTRERWFTWNVALPTIGGDGTGLSKWQAIANKSVQVLVMPQPSQCKKHLNFMFDSIGGSVSYTLGATLVNLGVGGFFKDTFDSCLTLAETIATYLKKHLHLFDSPEVFQYLMTAPPALVLAVLIGYFGGKFFRDVFYKSLLAICRGEYSPPESFKLYPKITLLAIALSAYASYYSTGACIALINKHFREAEFDMVRSVLLFCATYFTPIFNFKNVLEFYFDKSLKFTRRFGSDAAKAFADLDARITAFSVKLANESGEKLEANMRKLESNIQKMLLGMNEVTEVLPEENEPLLLQRETTQPSTRRCCL